MWDLVNVNKCPPHSELLNESLMKSIILYDLKINEKDSDGNTALHIAVKNSNIRVSKLLLDCGINKNIKNK